MRVPQFEFSIRVCQPSREFGERHPVCVTVSAVDRPTRLRSIPRTALADTAADRKQRPYIVALAAGEILARSEGCGGTHIYVLTKTRRSTSPIAVAADSESLDDESPFPPRDAEEELQ